MALKKIFLSIYKSLGYFKDGKRCGIGIYTWTDKSYYNGEWADDKMNGKGQFQDSDGTILRGLWKNDEFVGEII
jgi:hypothetical protein